MESGIKRFFNPSDGGFPSKHAKTQEEGGQDGDPPLSFLSWNADGLGLRMKLDDKDATVGETDMPAIWKTVGTHKPDVIVVQEVRLPANTKLKGKQGDGQVRIRATLNTTTKKNIDQRNKFLKYLTTNALKGYSVNLSLADWKYAGTAMLIREGVEKPRFSFNIDDIKNSHDSDGRVIIAEFRDLVVLSTYVPNNGKSETSIARRAQWDERIQAFLERKRAEGKPLVWIGDLNVANTDADVTNPIFFRNTQVKDSVTPSEKDDAGFPGFTRNEQRRFGDILEKADLVDAYRELHPAEKPAKYSEKVYTWRGSSKSSDMLFRKAMRLDYTCVSSELLPRLETADILGGADREHGFLGSDHCPILLTLRPAPAQ